MTRWNIGRLKYHVFFSILIIVLNLFHHTIRCLHIVIGLNILRTSATAITMRNIHVRNTLLYTELAPCDAISL